MSRRHSVGIAVLAMFLLMPSSALADTTVSFDDLSQGTAVTDQYASAGVVFGPLPGGISESAPPVLTSAPGQAHSASQVADINCYRHETCPNGGDGTYVPQATGTFSVPRSHVSVYVGLLGSAAPACTTDSEATCAAVTLVAFDSSGKQIAASAPEIVTQGAGVQTQLSVSTPSPQIAAFEVTTQEPTDNRKDVAIDDLSFDTPSTCDDVLTGQDLIDALQAGCTVIHVDDSARIDVAALDGNPFSTNDAVLNIPEGVTIESDRSATQLGGVLSMSHPLPEPAKLQPFSLPTCGDGECVKSMLEVGGRPVDGLPPGTLTHITGLRLLGYDPHDTTSRNDSTSAIRVHDLQHSLLADNNEMSGWPQSALNIGPVDDTPATAGRIHIANNFIHNNVQCNGGYGVQVGDPGYALIDRNVFNYDRHDATIGFDAPGAGYIATGNFILTGGPTCDGNYNQHFDVHGSDIPGTWIGGAAGGYIEVRHNAIRGDQHYGGACRQTRPAFDLRGTPNDKAIFAGNVLEHADVGAAIKMELRVIKACQRRFGSLNDKWRERLEGQGKLLDDGNKYGVNTSQQLAVGDFDGDGKADVFVATGAGWFYSPAGRREWRFLNSASERLNRLGFGDFNGDGKTDVFTQHRDRWVVSYGGTSQWRLLPAGSNIPMQGYRFYDFNGDGKTDIFRANGKQWYYSSGGATSWMPLADSSFEVDQLRFGDLNGDGKTDVFSLANHQWSVSYGGVTRWQRLNKQLSSNLGELELGDFNGDGHCDIARAHGRGFQVSYGGTSPWQQIDTRAQRQANFSGTLLGSFEGGEQVDVLEFAIDGSALDRFELMSNFGPVNDWSLQDML